MRISRFYVNQPLALGEQQLPEFKAHYMVRVLRLKAGDAVQLFDGSGVEFSGTLVRVDKKTAFVNLNERVAGLPESPLHVHLGQTLSRGERMDWVIQKTTELGVSEITPLWSEYCEVRLDEERVQKRLAHWRQIAMSACEQCGRSILPLIHSPKKLESWLEQVQADLKLVLHPGTRVLGEHVPPARLALLVGPEGGLSDSEIISAEIRGFYPTGLGPRVLRTETAPLAALATVQWLWGDLKN